jgi:hypothetical protein
MGAILALLARPLIEAAVSVFGQMILQYLATWKASQDARARGRAEAEREAATAAAKVAAEMGEVAEPEIGDAIRRLRDGLA